MSDLILALEVDVVREVFKKVEESWASKIGYAALYSPSSAVEAAVTEAWQKIEDVVGQCLRSGWELAQSRVSDVINYVQTTASHLGNKANEFREILLAKLRNAISATFDLVLSAMRSEVKVGGLIYRLKSVKLQQKLVFSGSVEGSLTALCKFVSSGELVVEGAYEFSKESS